MKYIGNLIIGIITIYIVKSISCENGGDIRQHKIYYDDGVLSETFYGDDSIDEDDTLLESRSFFTDFGKKIKRVGKVLHLYRNENQTLPLINEEYYQKAIDKIKKRLKLIYPGTHWCGDGDNARSFNHLGLFQETDKCCRGHDICTENIPGGKSKHGLTNTGIFTRSHCDCDTEFYECLKNSTDIISKQIGFTYFTVLGPKCFKEDFSTIGCMLYNKGKCIKYHLETAGEKTYQWFDNPPFN